MSMKRNVTTEQLLDLMAQFDLASPPDEVHDAMVAQLNTVIKPKSQPTVWQRITAQLKRDSADTAGGLALAGARDVRLNEPQAHDLLFTTDLVHVVLNVLSDGDHFTIDGQIFPQSDTVSDQLIIQLVQHDRDIALTQSDDLGEFSLASIPAGQYELVLCRDGIEIVIPAVSLA